MLRFRIPLLALVLALLAAAGAMAPFLGLDLSIVPLLEASASERRKVAEFHEAVPVRQLHVPCMLTWPRPIGEAELDLVGDLTDRLETWAGIDRVTSLASTPVVEQRDGRPIVMRFPQVAATSSVQQAAARHPLLQRTLLSADGCGAVLYLRYDDAAGIDRITLLDRVGAFLRAEVGPEVEVRILANEIVESAMRGHMIADIVRTLAAELVLFAILLPLLFRTVRGTVLPMLTIVVADVWLLGFLATVGWQLSIIDVAVPGLVTIIALCDAVHMMHRFEESWQETRDRRRAILDMMQRVGPACFCTSFTTALGFLSLLIADHAAVRSFGLKAGVAVAFAFIAVMVVLPLGLSLWPIRRDAPVRATTTAWLSYGRRRLTWLVAAAVLLVSLLGVGRVVIDSHWMEELPPDDPVVDLLSFYEANFAGLLTLDVKLEGDLRTPEAFRAVESLQAAMRGRDGVVKSESYADWVREVLGQPAEITDEQIGRGLARLGFLGDAFPRHVINPDFRRGRLTFHIEDLGTERFLAMKEDLEERARGLPVRAEVAGYELMAHESTRLVVTTMLRSFLLSLVSISLFIALVYRSVRIGLLSIVPNLLPIVFALGLCGWAGIEIRIGIVMIFSLGLGLAVDDTIHIISRFFQERREDRAAPARGLLLRTLRGAGRALLVSSIILCVGALTYLPSDFRSMRDVGILLSSMVVCALLADLYLLPHLLERWGEARPRRKTSIADE